jgi:hypothetical protein
VHGPGRAGPCRPCGRGPESRWTGTRISDSVGLFRPGADRGSGPTQIGTCSAERLLLLLRLLWRLRLPGCQAASTSAAA